MPHYRVTRPERYSLNTPGYNNPAARQGYYADARDDMDAANIVRQRLIEAGTWGSGEPETAFDVQPWNDDTKGPGVPPVRVTFETRKAPFGATAARVNS